MTRFPVDGTGRLSSEVEHPTAALTGPAGGDLTGSFPNPTVATLNGQHLGWLRYNVYRIPVKDYGAKGDLYLGIQASIVGGTKALTLSDASLTNADVGKVVCINSAGTGGNSSFTTTISAVGSGTTCTTTDTVPATVSSVGYAYGTDDTNAFIGAIAAAAALGVSQAEIGLEPVGYMINGPFVSSNTVIAMPNPGSVPARFALSFRGPDSHPFASIIGNGQHPPQGRGKGTLIFWAFTNQGAPTTDPYTTYGAVPSLFGDTSNPYSNDIAGCSNQCTPYFENIAFLAPHRPPGTFLDMGAQQSFAAKGLCFVVNEASSGYSASPYTTAWGLICPSKNNNFVAVDTITAMGLYGGVIISDEATLTGPCGAYQCKIAIGIDVPGMSTGEQAHISRFHAGGTDWTISGITFGSGESATPAGRLVIDALYAEGAGGVNNDSGGNFSVRANFGPGFTGGGPYAYDTGTIAWNATGDAAGYVSSLPSVPASGAPFSVRYKNATYNLSGGSTPTYTVGGVSVTPDSAGNIRVPSGRLLVPTYGVTPPTLHSLCLDA